VLRDATLLHKVPTSIIICRKSQQKGKAAAAAKAKLGKPESPIIPGKYSN